MTTATLPGTRWHPHHTITLGALDDDARFAFNNGQCHAFALALHTTIGGTLTWAGHHECPNTHCHGTPIDPNTCTCQIEHLLVHNHGEHYDISGAWDTPTLLDIYNAIGTIDHPTALQLAHQPGWVPPALDAAHAVIPAYLEFMNLTTHHP